MAHTIIEDVIDVAMSENAVFGGVQIIAKTVDPIDRSERLESVSILLTKSAPDRLKRALASFKAIMDEGAPQSRRKSRWRQNEGAPDKAVTGPVGIRCRH
ncbi:MAG: hypothetical protein WDN46_10140 [Methylocella sp.]